MSLFSHCTVPEENVARFREPGGMEGEILLILSSVSYVGLLLVSYMKEIGDMHTKQTAYIFLCYQYTSTRRRTIGNTNGCWSF